MLQAQVPQEEDEEGTLNWNVSKAEDIGYKETRSSAAGMWPMTLMTAISKFRSLLARLAKLEKVVQSTRMFDDMGAVVDTEECIIPPEDSDRTSQ